MIYIISFLLLLSLITNIIFSWYVKKLTKNTNEQINFVTEQLNLTVSNIDEVQKMFEEYADGLNSILDLEQNYDDEIFKTVIANTRLVIQGCQMYKETVFKSQADREQKIDNKEQ